MLSWFALPLAALLGVGLDRLLGEPRRGHPLVAFGRWANLLEKALRLASRERLTATDEAGLAERAGHHIHRDEPVLVLAAIRPWDGIRWAKGRGW